MAKFRYRMQNILDVKEKLESQEKIAFAQANALLLEEQEKLTELLKRRASYEEHLKEIENGILDLREIHHTRNAINTMKSLIRDQMLEVHKAQNNVEVARKKLDAIIKDRKTHENLKEKAFEQFIEEINAEENKVVDELVSYTYGNAKDK